MFLISMAQSTTCARVNSFRINLKLHNFLQDDLHAWPLKFIFKFIVLKLLQTLSNFTIFIIEITVLTIYNICILFSESKFDDQNKLCTIQTRDTAKSVVVNTARCTELHDVLCYSQTGGNWKHFDFICNIYRHPDSLTLNCNLRSLKIRYLFKTSNIWHVTSLSMKVKTLLVIFVERLQLTDCCMKIASIVTKKKRKSLIFFSYKLWIK